MIHRHSILAHNACLDLKRLLLDEAVADIKGTPKLKLMSGRGYWYDQYYLGSKVVDRYLGEDNAEFRARLAEIEQLKAGRDARRKRRQVLVSHLRAEGVLTVDSSVGSLLAAFEKSGVFRVGGTIVGTTAFRLYEAELGVRFGAEIAQTQDVDIASFERLSLAIEDTVNPSLDDVFRALQFEPVPTLDKGRVWRWRQTRGEALVEFLTPSFEEGEPVKPLAALNVSAQALHFLNYAIAGPIKAVVPYRSGVLVQIPRPERYAIHKLIVSERRKEDNLKIYKDRQQAARLIEVLAEDRPDELRDAYETALSSGDKWRRHIEAALAKMPDTKAILDGLF